MRSHIPSHRSWNKTVHDFFPYQDIEKDPEKLWKLLENHEILGDKVRDLSIGDILRLSPNATRKKGRRLGYDEDELDDSVWPLAPLTGCPQEGVLTIEGAGHLGTMMTQLAMLYSLSRSHVINVMIVTRNEEYFRRDSKYAFLPTELDLPLRQTFQNIRNKIATITILQPLKQL